MPGLATLTWNDGDELLSSPAGSGTVYFQYAGGQRIRKYEETTGAMTKERIYIGGWEVYRERSNGTTISEETETLHVHDDVERVLMVEEKTVGTGTGTYWRYQLSNHLGSASAELDNNRVVFSYEEFHPFGTSAYRAHDSTLSGASPRRYRFTGMERDEETGLAYHGARYYAPWLGRWTAADPIGLGDGVNRFRYTANNPVGFVDRTGTFAGPPGSGTIDPAEGSHEMGVLGRSEVRQVDQEATPLDPIPSDEEQEADLGDGITDEEVAAIDAEGPAIVPLFLPSGNGQSPGRQHNSDENGDINWDQVATEKAEERRRRVIDLYGKEPTIDSGGPQHLRATRDLAGRQAERAANTGDYVGAVWTATLVVGVLLKLRQSAAPQSPPQTEGRILTEGEKQGQKALGAADDAAKAAGGGGFSSFKAPKAVTNRHGELTNGAYTLDKAGMAPHTTGSLSGGRSQFLHRVNERQLTLDAAAYADEAGLWVGNKAKVTLDNYVGVHGGTGLRTKVINVYRTKTGHVHAAPGTPK